MTVQRAILIQDINEFIACIKPYLIPILEVYQIDEESALKWIIVEEIELVYSLFDKRHVRNMIPHIHIRDQLRGELPMALSSLFAWFIKAPKIYSDHNEIEVIVRGRDLHIKYFADIKQFR